MKTHCVYMCGVSRKFRAVVRTATSRVSRPYPRPTRTYGDAGSREPGLHVYCMCEVKS